MVYGRYLDTSIVNGVYKPTNITGGAHIVWLANGHPTQGPGAFEPRCSGDQPPGRPGAAGEGRVSSDPRQEFALETLEKLRPEAPKKSISCCI